MTTNCSTLSRSARKFARLLYYIHNKIIFIITSTVQSSTDDRISLSLFKIFEIKYALYSMKSSISKF